MTDPRIAPVEDNLIAFMTGMLRLPTFQHEPWDDVVAGHTDIPFPLFNTIADARFAPGTEARRTRAVLARFLERRLPFLWWLTPSTTSPDLERVLAESGLQREDVPGMHRYLDGTDSPDLPAGVEVREVDLDDGVDPFLTTLLDAFGMPRELHGPWAEVMTAFSGPDLVDVVASAGGEPVGVGTAWLTGDTVGLYNIATLPAHRGRGVGRAVTARLMQLGAARGARQAVLHASEEGLPLYERLGFETVCVVPQYVWTPDG